jgi:RHS repeat-associated protein
VRTLLTPRFRFLREFVARRRVRRDRSPSRRRPSLAVEELEPRVLLSETTLPVAIPFTKTRELPLVTAVSQPARRAGDLQALQTPGQPDQTVPVRFTFLEHRAAYRNELGLFVVDDESGRIGSLLPGDRGYAAAALARRQLIFARTQHPGATTVLDMPGGSFFGMYLVQDAAAAEFLAHNAPDRVTTKPRVFFTFLRANPDHTNHVHRGTGGRFAFEDLTFGGDRDFNDLVARMKFLPPRTATVPPVRQPPSSGTMPCNFPDAPGDWSIAEGGGTGTGRGSATITDCGAVIREGNSFQVTLRHSLTLPATPSVLRFQFDGPSFDTTAQHVIHDAFEAALVDASGNSLVHTVRPNHDAYFNISEGQSAALGAGATFDGHTVTVPLAGLAPGSTATLVLRLVNNDHDTNTSVNITDLEVQAGGPTSPVLAVPTIAAATTAPPVDFSLLSDISPSFIPDYGQTSFDETTQVLHADLAVHNTGQYSAGAPLVVAISHISDPAVLVANADGTTPDGLPYFDYSNLVSGSAINPGDAAGMRTVQFFNPQRTPFTYDLVVLGHLNRPPAFASRPSTEGTPGVPYTYAATATDPDHDPLTFTLLAGPQGMNVDAASGAVTWAPQQDDLGTHSVTLQVADGHGGTDRQQFAVAVTAAPPNRPPVFTSTPVVDATVNTAYSYPAAATDPDGDPLTFTVISGPQGLSIDPATGLVTWAPTVAQLGTDAVTLRVDDGKGGTATQTYVIGVQQEKGNHLPVITSTPVTQYQVPDPLTVQGGSIFVTGEDPDFHATQGPTATGARDIIRDGLAFVRNADPKPFLWVESNIAPPAGHARGIDGIKAAGFVEGTDFVHVDASQLPTVNFADYSAIAVASDGGGLLTQAELDVLNARAADIATYVTGGGGLLAFSEFGDSSNVGLTNSGHFGFLPFLTSSLAKNQAESGNTLTAFGERLGLVPDDINGNFSHNIFANDGGMQVVAQDPSGAILGLAFRGKLTTSGVVPTAPYSYPARAVDADNDPLTWSLTAGPTGMTIDSSTGQMIWNAAAQDVGPHDVTVRVDDGRGGFDTQSYVLNVLNAQPGEIEGTKFNDVNGDGLRNLSSGNAAPAPLFNVLGTSDPYLAGQPDGASADSGDTAPAESPVLASGVALTPGQPLMFTILAGLIDGSAGKGGSGISHAALNGISGLLAPGGSLVGVFLGPNLPDPASAPAMLDFYDTTSVPGGLDYQSLSPQPDQVFFIGDGRTSKGDVRQIIVPAGATRLYLATAGGGGWHGNSGSLAVDVAPFDPTNGPEPITLTPIATNFNNLIHVDYYEPDNTLIASVNYSGGQPRNFEEIRPDGSHVPFSKVSGFTDEVYIAIARSSDVGGFKPGDLFVGNGQDGQIARITDGGRTVISPWVTLPGSGHGLFRGYLTFDRTGVFSGDLIAETNQGEVWRIDATGHATEVANTRSFLEGVEVIPNDPTRYGPLAGTILATDENSTGFFSITSAGQVTFHDIGVGGLEDAHVIPANQNFFGADYAHGRALAIRAAELAPMVGDILFTQEFGGGLFRMFWDGQALQVQPLDLAAGSTAAGLWEGSNFAPAGVAPLPPVPLEPGLPTWTIYLDLNHNGKRDPGEPFTMTDALGHYTFTNLAPGTYTVAEEGQPGWRETTPKGIEQTVTVVAGQVTSGVDFGNTQLDVTTGVPRPLAFTSTAPTTGVVGQIYRYDTAVSNPDGATLSFDLPAHPAGMTVDSTTGVLVWLPAPDELGPQTVVLRVADGRGGVALQSFQVTVAPASTAPVFTSTPPPPQSVVALPYQYRVRAQDSANDAITFHLDQGPAGMMLDAATGLLTYTPTAADVGTQHVQITADNGHGGTAVQVYDLIVVATATDHAPDITSSPRTITRLDRTYLYAVQATDPDGDPLTFTLDTSPAGMTIDATGMIRWDPTPAQFGANQVVVRVSDGRGGTKTQEFTVTVISQDVNHPPSITSAPPPAATVGRTYAYNPTGLDLDGDPLMWTLVKGPAGMSIDAITGAVRWVPTTDQLGSQDVEIQVDDALLVSATQSFTITVRSVNVPPLITSLPPTEAVTGTDYAYAVQVTDAENDPLTYTLTTAPAGMQIDATTGIIHWTPAAPQVGPQDVIVEVDDGQGGTATQVWTVVVSDQAGNHAPAITSAPPLNGTVGGLYQYPVQATDPDGDALTFTLLSGPGNMTIDTATGQLRWGPTAAQLGTNLIAVAARDPHGALGVQRFAVIVIVNQPPHITSTPTTTVTAGTTYRYDVQAADPDGDALTYSLTAPPTGMTIDAMGRITWSPAIADIGTHHVVLTVTDPVGASATQPFDVSVVADTMAPQVNVVVVPERVNVHSSVKINVTATDDVQAQRMTLTVGGVPVSLDAHGSATVTMDTIGLFDAVATAVDPAGNVGTATATVRVVDPTDTTGPTVQITSPTTDTTITTLTQITGTVTDPHLELYHVEYAPFDQVDLNNLATATADWKTIAQGTAAVTNGALGTFDPTMLMNDAYVIRVLAQNINGNVTAQGIVLTVSGNLKLGQFTQEFTDLSIPLAGIPIQVTRVYDTRQSGTAGDFGFGWRLGIQDAHTHETVPQPTDNGILGLFTTAAFRTDTKVYLTAPNGQREGFTFNPTPQATFLGTFWHPHFDPDPGVFDQLSVDDAPLVRATDGTFHGFLFGFSYNPDDYTLTTKDGIGFRYNQTAGLERITDPNGNTITFTAAGITSSTGAAVVFERDAQGRISEVIDPQQHALHYDYDAQGDLASVTDQAGLRSTFSYLAQPAHYLDTVVDPLGHLKTRTEYDAQGRLLRTTDALGNVTAHGFDASTLTETVTDPTGQVTTLVYDDRGNVIAHTDPSGNTNRYTYDANNNLVSVTNARQFTTLRTVDARGNTTSITDAQGKTYTLTYNEFNKVRTVTDPLGHTVTSLYDASGQLIGQVNAAGFTSSATRDAQGRIISLTDNAGNTTTYDYADGPKPVVVHNPDGSTVQWAYDTFGNVIRSVDENGNASVLTYDDSGRLLAQQDATGHAETYTYDGTRLASVTDRLGRTTRFEYDAADHRIRQIDPLGGVTQYVYDGADRVVKLTDAMGNTTVNHWMPNGMLAGATDSLGNSITYEYDADGNRTAVIDARRDTSRFEYDSNDRLIKFTNALGNSQTYTYDDAGNISSVLDESGQRYFYFYDDVNQLVRQVDPLGDAFSYTYDPEGNVTGVTDPNGHTTDFAYNNRGMLVQRTDPSGGVTQYTLDPTGLVRAVKDPLGNTTTFEHDPLGRKVKTVDPLGAATAFEYDAEGNLISTTDPLGRTTQFAYDALNRRISETDPLGSQTRSTYDLLGNVLSTTDPLGQTTQFTYDAVGNLIRETDPLGNSRTYTYDPVGNRISETDRDGRTRTFQYDAVNQQVGEVWLSGTTVVRNIQYTYDPLGLLVTAADPNSDYRFGYDAAGRLTSADNAGTPGVPQVALTYGYDAAGNTTSVTDNLGATVNSTYDARDLLTSRTWQGAGLASVRVDFSHDADGNLTGVDRFADLTGTQKVGDTQYTYDPVGRVTLLQHTDATGSVLAAYSHTYDDAGQLLHQADHGQTVDYTYDKAGQLTGVISSAQPAESYTYDGAGNRSGGGAVVGADNQIRSDSTYDYTYDGEGNLVSRSNRATGDVTRLSYDYRNRLVSVEEQDSSGKVLHQEQFTYDVFDRRIAVTQDGTTTYTAYDQDSVWADFDASGKVTARYLSGEHVDQLMARWQPGTGTSWYLTDQLGTVRDIAGPTGGVIDHIDYDSFGNVLLETAPAAGDRFKFTGRELDALSGLYYYRARYYDPHLGRFISNDPLGFDAGDANLQRYVFNRPTELRDPFGQAGAELAGVQSAVATEVAVLNQPGEATKEKDIELPCLKFHARVTALTPSGGNLAAQDLADFAFPDLVLDLIVKFTVKIARSKRISERADINDKVPLPNGAIVLRHGFIETTCDTDTCREKADSDELRTNLNNNPDPCSGDGEETKGNPDGRRNEAHHIVPGTDPGALPARLILEKCGICINDARNGIFLPHDSDSAGEQGSPALPHSNTFPRAYVITVNAIIIAAYLHDGCKGPEGVESALHELKCAIATFDNFSRIYHRLLRAL